MLRRFFAILVALMILGVDASLLRLLYVQRASLRAVYYVGKLSGVQDDIVVAAIPGAAPVPVHPAALKMVELGPGSVPIISYLAGPDDERRRAISTIWAIGAIGNPKGTEGLKKYLEHADRDVRVYALVTMGLIGEKDPQVVPRMLAALGDENPEVRRAAFGYLCGFEGLRRRLLREHLLDYHLERDPEKVAREAREWWSQERAGSEAPARSPRIAERLSAEGAARLLQAH